MKKIITSIVIGIILAAFAMPAVSYAQISVTKGIKLFEIEKDIGGEKAVENITNLPDVNENFPKLYAGLTRILLGAASVLAVVGFFAAGIVYVSAQGSEETIKKATNIMLYTMLGVLIIAAAYGITLGIAKLQLG